MQINFIASDSRFVLFQFYNSQFYHLLYPLYSQEFYIQSLITTLFSIICYFVGISSNYFYILWVLSCVVLFISYFSPIYSQTVWLTDVHSLHFLYLYNPLLLHSIKLFSVLLSSSNHNLSLVTKWLKQCLLIFDLISSNRWTALLYIWPKSSHSFKRYVYVVQSLTNIWRLSLW